MKPEEIAERLVGTFPGELGIEHVDDLWADLSQALDA